MIAGLIPPKDECWWAMWWPEQWWSDDDCEFFNMMQQLAVEAEEEIDLDATMQLVEEL